MNPDYIDSGCQRNVSCKQAYSWALDGQIVIARYTPDKDAGTKNFRLF